MKQPWFVIAVGIALLAGACSVPAEESARLIPQSDLAPSLQQDPPSTTSTTLPEIRTREFAYFLLAEKEDTPQRVVEQVVASIEQDFSLFEAIDAMDVEGFKDRIGADPTLLNVVLQYDVVGVDVDDGVATVSLRTLGETPDNPVLRDVAAQLVWTLTGEEGVNAVLINIDDAPAQLPTTNDDNLTDRPVTIDDYQAYNSEPVEPPETTTTTNNSTTTTTTTTTTVPPSDG